MQIEKKRKKRKEIRGRQVWRKVIFRVILTAGYGNKAVGGVMYEEIRADCSNFSIS